MDSMEKFFNVVKYGKQYYPPTKYQGRVYCDLCHKTNLQECIGLEDVDLCITCADNIKKVTSDIVQPTRMKQDQLEKDQQSNQSSIPAIDELFSRMELKRSNSLPPPTKQDRQVTEIDLTEPKRLDQSSPALDELFSHMELNRSDPIPTRMISDLFNE